MLGRPAQLRRQLCHVRFLRDCLGQIQIQQTDHASADSADADSADSDSADSYSAVFPLAGCRAHLRPSGRSIPASPYVHRGDPFSTDKPPRLSYTFMLSYSLQIAELISVTLEKPTLSRNKTVEVVAETTQPLLKFSEMLAEIPADDEEEGEAVEVREEVERAVLVVVMDGW